ncbi:MAG: hypothetical protein ACLGIA_06015 [Actinomycetes bacterium]
MAVVAAVATGLLVLLAPESMARTTSRMDWLGVGCLVVSVGAMLIALNEAGKLAGASWVLVAVLGAVSVVMFVAFRRVEDRGVAPARRDEAPAAALDLGPAAHDAAHHDRRLRGDGTACCPRWSRTPRPASGSPPSRPRGGR